MHSFARSVTDAAFPRERAWPLQSRTMPFRPPSPATPLAPDAFGLWVVPRCALGAALLCLGLAWSGRESDRALLLALQQLSPDWALAWSLLTWSALGIASLLWLTALSSREPRRVAGILIAMLLGGIVVHAIKRSLGVDRPLAVFGADHPLFQVIGEPLRRGSMPSGHTTTAWTVAGLMTLSSARGAIWRHGWWLLAAAQGLSRVMVGAHWPSDVLAGAGVGLILAPTVWCLGWTQRLGHWLDQPRVRPWVGGALPVLALLLCLLDLGTPLPLASCALLISLGLYGMWRWSSPLLQPAVPSA